MPRQESWEILDLGSWIPAVSIETETFQLKRPGSKIQDFPGLLPRHLGILNPKPAVSIETETCQLKRAESKIWDSKMPRQESWEILDLGSWIPAVSIETETFQLKRPAFEIFEESYEWRRGHYHCEAEGFLLHCENSL